MHKIIFLSNFQFPACVQVTFDLLFGTAGNSNAKLRTMAIGFIHHLIDQCPENQVDNILEYNHWVCPLHNFGWDEPKYCVWMHFKTEILELKIMVFGHFIVQKSEQYCNRIFFIILMLTYVVCGWIPTVENQNLGLGDIVKRFEELNQIEPFENQTIK